MRKKIIKNLWDPTLTPDLTRWPTDEEVELAIRSVPMHFAAPTPVSIGTPAGIMLRDGFATKWVFGAVTNFSLWEIAEEGVTPGEWDVGEGVNTTTMRNTRFETSAPSGSMGPNALIRTGPHTIMAGYDPNIWNVARDSLIGIRTTCTKQYPDGTTYTFYGYLQKLTPSTLKRKAVPLCTAVVWQTNWDHVNNVEAGPVITSVSGT